MRARSGEVSPRRIKTPIRVIEAQEKEQENLMLAKTPKTGTVTLAPAADRIPSPCSRTWTIAVHEAGHCVMAYLLGVGIVRGVIRPDENTGNVWWRHAGKRYSALGKDPHSRAEVEADALVALAGAAAQWLYKQGSVRGFTMAFDDSVAMSILKQVETENAVASRWREYLRQRALVMLTPQRCQALIARLAGRFIEQKRLRGDAIEDFLRQQEGYIRPLLIQDGTVEDYVGLIGTDAFAKPVETLPLGMPITTRLRAEGIRTVGRLLQYGPYDLSAIPGLVRRSIRKIERVVGQAGFELPQYARSDCDLVSFDPEFIREIDRDLARRRADAKT